MPHSKEGPSVVLPCQTSFGNTWLHSPNIAQHPLYSSPFITTTTSPSSFTAPQWSLCAPQWKSHGAIRITPLSFTQPNMKPIRRQTVQHDHMHCSQCTSYTFPKGKDKKKKLGEEGFKNMWNIVAYNGLEDQSFDQKRLFQNASRIHFVDCQNILSLTRPSESFKHALCFDVSWTMTLYQDPISAHVGRWQPLIMSLFCHMSLDKPHHLNVINLLPSRNQQAKAKQAWFPWYTLCLIRTFEPHETNMHDYS